MAFNVNQFAAAMKHGGARPSHFQVQITNPINGVADADVPFKVKTTSIPASTVTPIEQFYFGRPVNFAGNRTFEEWTASVIVDEDFSIRNALEQWHNSINSLQGNISTSGGTNPSLYKANATVTQFSKDGNPIREYDFVGLWPTEIGQIELGWENGDTIEEFDVTFKYDYWRISGGTTGDAGGV